MIDVSEIVNKQREFFKTNTTKSLDFRISALINLKQGIVRYEDVIFDALKKDLGKSDAESYMCEVGLVLEEIDFAIKNIKKWIKPKKVRTSISQMPGKSYIYKEPYGNVLIMSPWNYPFQLAITPLIGAIAGGNCSIIKPSEYSSYTSKVIKSLIEDIFNNEYITVIEGGRDINQNILNEKFDYIFFTGSVGVGKIVMEKAAKNLTPVTLELGGKSPCIIDDTCDIKLAAKKVAWGKFLNSGQTCVAPDYIFVHEKVKDSFINEIKKVIKNFYGENPLKSDSYSNIINLKHLKRLEEYLKSGSIIVGGEVDSNNRKISPTLIENVSLEDKIMQEEIFGPILPILKYKDINKVIEFITATPKPLALYLFTNKKETENKVLESISFGGGCINDVVIHLATSNMPFGGVGSSGIGKYHGKYSFETFTHEKSILKKKGPLDIKLRYPPYNGKLNRIKKILGR